MNEIIKIEEVMPVDSGTMALISKDVLDKYGKLKPSPKRVFSLIKKITIKTSAIVILGVKTENTRGYVKKLDKGIYYLGDPCYIIKDWDKFLKDTNYMESYLPNCIFVKNFGGDGLHKVFLGIHDYYKKR
jgi:hypothetical protein